MKILIIIFIQIAIIWKTCEAVFCDITPKNTEGKLTQHLLCHYDKDARPVSDHNKKINVTIKMVVKSFSFSDSNPKLTVNSWIAMRWIDEHLKWNKAEYDNIDEVTVHADELWMPDLTIYNSKTTQFTDTCTMAYCVIYSSGAVSCIPPCSHEADCKADYTNWPFDVQNCSMHLGSWVHKGEAIDYQSQRSAVEVPDLKNQEWKLIGMSVKKNRGNYSCCPDETYPSLQYNFLIERHSATETTMLVSPALIMILLNILSLVLSPNSTERIVINTLSIFAHFTYLQHLYWLLPHNGDTVPKAALYFQDSLIISAYLVFHTILMRSILSRATNIPDWFKKATESLKRNKAGQVIFSNPYLINNTPLNNDDGNEDAVDLVEEQPVSDEQNQKKKDNSQIALVSVKIIDSLLLIILIVVYIVLLFGWIPISYVKYKDRLNVDLISE